MKLRSGVSMTETSASLGKRYWKNGGKGGSSPKQLRQHGTPTCNSTGIQAATHNLPPSGTSGASTSAGLLGGMSLSARRHLRQHRPPRPRSPVSVGLRRSNRRTTYRPNNDDDDSDPDDVDDKKDEDYDPDDDVDDDDDELADLTAQRLRNIIKSARYRTEHREQVLANKKLYRENNRDFIAVAGKCYRERNRAQVAKSKKRYREKNRAQVAAASKRYRERHREQVMEYGQRYREKHRARLKEYNKAYRETHRAQRLEREKRYRENNQEQRLAYQRRYREDHRELLREKGKRYRARLAEKKRTGETLKTLGPLAVTIPLTVCRTQPSVESYLNNFCASLPSVERQKTEEKIKALGPLKLTIPLEDFMKSRPVTSPETEHSSFCESFLDSYTLTDMDSGVTQALDPPDLEDLSFLENISPDEWTELLRDVEDSSSFDLEALLLPEDLVHDMSPDEGVDLMYDLVT